MAGCQAILAEIIHGALPLEYGDSSASSCEKRLYPAKVKTAIAGGFPAWVMKVCRRDYTT
jgi:hypothetical protein